MANAGIVVESQVASQLPICREPTDLLDNEEIPAWLNELFIEKTLQKYFDDKSLKVKKLKVFSCGGKGDSYASVMYRIGTFYSNQKSLENFISLIVKTLPDNEMAQEKLGSGNYNVQSKEMDMYEKLLPEYKRILKSIGEDFDCFPEVIGVDRSLECIIMEDLMERKFVMKDRLEGLDSNHILLSLKKLAKMHAASIIINQNNPELFKNMDTGFFTRKTDVFHVMFESLCDCLIEEIPNWKGFEHYEEKLKNVRKNLVKYARKAFDNEEGDLQVLNHGKSF